MKVIVINVKLDKENIRRKVGKNDCNECKMGSTPLPKWIHQYKVLNCPVILLLSKILVWCLLPSELLDRGGNLHPIIIFYFDLKKLGLGAWSLLGLFLVGPSQ